MALGRKKAPKKIQKALIKEGKVDQNLWSPGLSFLTHSRHSHIQELVYVSHDVFDAYRKHHYKAGCHLGVISSSSDVEQFVGFVFKQKEDSGGPGEEF